MDCDKFYTAVWDEDDSVNYNYVLFDLADCFIKGYDPEKLRAMLKADIDGVVESGLFIANEIGSLARDYMPEFSVLMDSQEPEIRRMATILFERYKQK